MNNKAQLLSGKKIRPAALSRSTDITDLVDNVFTAYNAARLREACHLLKEKMLKKDVTLGLSMSGALTPTGLGLSCLIPLIKAGYIDWIVSTGANLYHDAHFGIGLSLHQGNPFIKDTVLRNEGVVRIYDILFDYDVLLKTDSFFREMIKTAEFQKEMGTAEFHYLAGKYVTEREKALGIADGSVLSVCYKCGVPVYTSAPGDSSIGMNISAMALKGNKLRINSALDVNETAAIVLDAKRQGGKSGVFILGGGSPKNFILQTEPHIQEVLEIDEEGHDYFMQITDARPDTGGLSGATPSEAVSWGKIAPEALPNTVVCYADLTIALPIITTYTLSNNKVRKLKRLYDRRKELLNSLKQAL
jgi:deoxyhypusine synthase